MTNAKIAIGVAMIGAFALGAAAISYSTARQDGASEELPADVKTSSSHSDVASLFSDAEASEIGEIVRAYLLENPEVIIDAVNAYSEQQRVAAAERQENAAARLLPELLNGESGFVAGKNVEKAKVAVIEMFDYHCGYCKKAAGQVKELVKNDAGVKVIFRELPILREESDIAAELALAAREQGKFLDFHFAMMDASGVLTKDRILSIAKSNGIDPAKLEKDAEAPEVAAAIRFNHDVAAEMGIEGTPAFIVATLDGKYIDFINGYSEAALKEKIREAKKVAG